MNAPTLKQPSAFLPIVMSLVTIAVMLYSFARFGIVHEEDEGTAAHIFQLMMAGQLPIVAWFALRWVPRSPRRALPILALQIGAALVAMAPVFYFKL